MTLLSPTHHSMSELYSKIHDCIDKGKLNKALYLISRHIDDIVTEPICTSQVFGAKNLDFLCQEIGKQCLHTFFKSTKQDPNSSPQHTYVYIASKLQQTGGHTRVIEDLILVRPNDQHIILVSGLAGKSDKEAILKRFKKYHVQFYWAAPLNYLGRLQWLQQKLIEIVPKNIYLFNHHHDSVIVAAIQPEMNSQTYFYHHGDHHLCLGLYLEGVIHIDPHPMGYHNCRHHLGIKNNIYYPLVIKDQGSIYLDRNKFSSQFITCTVANRNKIEHPYFINYANVVPMIIQTTKGKHIHIGQLSPKTISNIKHGLLQRGLEENLFIYVPHVKSVWLALQIYEVDMYIASFPYGGARTLVEVMGAGIPVAIHDHYATSLLSAIDMSYPGTFTWREPEQLLSYLNHLSTEQLQSTSQVARKHFLQHFHEKILPKAIMNHGHSIKGMATRMDHHPDMLQWSLDVVNQYTLPYLMHRILKKFIRSMHATFIFWMKDLIKVKG